VDFDPDGPVVDLTEDVAAVFASDGPLASAIPDFEPREAQRQMAAAVSESLGDGGVLLAEAGTGTGKTLAYLVPAILSRRRVLVSTGTKNLQEQIVQKDLPVLAEAIDRPFTATVMKGRANYLCLHRFQALKTGGLPRQQRLGGFGGRGNEVDERILLPIIDGWARATDTGDRAELKDLPEDLPLWSEIAASAENCLGRECPQFNDCFVTRMRQRAAESDLVIVNHHLLFADAAVRQGAYGEVIPDCDAAVLDEAHQLEDVATQYFGVTVSNYRAEDLARDAERMLARWPDPDRREPALRIVERIRDRAERLFARLEPPRRGAGDERARVTPEALTDAQEPGRALIGSLEGLEAAIQLLKDLPPETTPPPGALDDLLAVGARSGSLRVDLTLLLNASDPDYVFFLETRGRGIFFRAAPIDVSAIVRELLFDRMRTTVLTSATLTVDGAFGYIRDRLGIRGAAEIRLASEFDFERQTVLYLPPRMPDPRSAEFAGAAGRQVIEILRRTRGRAFVLFTSYATLRAVQAMAEMALDYPILVQGTMPRSLLLKRFRETPHSVLLATSSFWQGVDVVGEALSCVIIDKLPFASPGEPVTAARIEAIRARGGEPFDEYQVPLAILALRQGLGRLIRHRSDRGVLTVLDPRLRTKGYGRRFLASLPPAPVVHELDAVSAFLAADLV